MSNEKISKKGQKIFAVWHGVPREEIKWHPTVEKELCIWCGLCVLGCAANVYAFDFNENKPVVVAPLELQGRLCNLCQHLSSACNRVSFAFIPAQDYKEKEGSCNQQR